MPSSACRFCERVAQTEENAVAFDDNYPVAPGHRLVVPARHVARLEELEPYEWDAVFRLVRHEVRRIRSARAVDGVNVGVNSGAAAGQTVDHAHVHLIPRREGDVPDPRGGVRWVIPDKAAYWSSG